MVGNVSHYVDAKGELLPEGSLRQNTLRLSYVSSCLGWVSLGVFEALHEAPYETSEQFANKFE
jgi:hypothetical protein